jgi:hypothetical protein
MNAREVFIIAFTPRYWTLAFLFIFILIAVLNFSFIDPQPPYVVLTSTLGCAVSALALKLYFSAGTGYFVKNVTKPLRPRSIFTRRAKLFGVALLLQFVALLLLIPLFNS